MNKPTQYHYNVHEGSLVPDILLNIHNELTKLHLIKYHNIDT